MQNRECNDVDDDDDGDDNDDDEDGLMDGWSGVLLL